MPANDQLMQNRSMQYISARILKAPVWHLNRRSASRAVLVGMFFAFVPLPMQMLLAAIGCIYLRANLPLAIACVWITNPITTVPVFYFTYKIGALILGLPSQSFSTDMDLNLIWQPLLLGSLITGIATAAISYTTIDLLWRLRTVKRWHRRQMSKKLTRNAKP